MYDKRNQRAHVSLLFITLKDLLFEKQYYQPGNTRPLRKLLDVRFYMLSNLFSPYVGWYHYSMLMLIRHIFDDFNYLEFV